MGHYWKAKRFPKPAAFGREWSKFYGGARQSRSLAGILIFAAAAVWFVSRTQAYTDLVQNKRQQAMGGFGLLMSAATAPMRYFPWYDDSAAAARYDAEHDIFKDFLPFRQANFTPSGVVRTEKGILVVIRLASIVFSAPATPRRSSRSNLHSTC
jgi:hypothetical protein